MVQFINNPTYECLANAKQIRDRLERTTVSSHPCSSSDVRTVKNRLFRFARNSRIHRPKRTISISIEVHLESSLRGRKKDEPVWYDHSLNLWAMFSTVFHTSKEREEIIVVFDLSLSSRKIRLDVDHCSYRPSRRKLPASSSLLTQLHEELNSLPAEVYSIEFTTTSNGRVPTEVDDDYLNKNGIILRCKLSETPNPILPPLRLRISTRYPEEPPEILSLTKTMSPKLEFTGSNLRLSVNVDPRFGHRAVAVVNPRIASRNKSHLLIDLMRKAKKENWQLEEQRVEEWLLALLICQIE